MVLAFGKGRAMANSCGAIIIGAGPGRPRHRGGASGSRTERRDPLEKSDAVGAVWRRH
jgi:hypothetical protein